MTVKISRKGTVQSGGTAKVGPVAEGASRGWTSGEEASVLGCSGGGETQAAGSTLALTLGETWRMMPRANSCCRTLLGAKTEAR